MGFLSAGLILSIGSSTGLGISLGIGLGRLSPSEASFKVIARCCYFVIFIERD